MPPFFPYKATGDGRERETERKKEKERETGANIETKVERALLNSI